MGLEQDFLSSTKGRNHKGKVDKLNHSTIKTLWPSKSTSERVKKQVTIWDISTHAWQRISILKIHTNAYKLIGKRWISHLKQRQKLWRGRHRRGMRNYWTREKCLASLVIRTVGNEMSLYTLHWPQLKCLMIASVVWNKKSFQTLLFLSELMKPI